MTPSPSNNATDDKRDAGAAYNSLAERADIVFAGNDQAILFTGVDNPHTQLEALRRLGPECVVIKLGAAVATVHEGDAVLSVANNCVWTCSIPSALGMLSWQVPLAGGDAATLRRKNTATLQQKSHVLPQQFRTV